MFISHLVPYALHGGDPLKIFKINEFSQRIRENYRKGKFFEGMIQKHMGGNPHYLRLLYTPDKKKPKEMKRKTSSNFNNLKKSCLRKINRQSFERQKLFKNNKSSCKTTRSYPP
jgi:Zn-dependent M16 (insulinase) family peptidase